MAKLLLAHKADVPPEVPGSGVTPIQCAISLKRHDIWPMLLDHGADFSDIGIGNGGSMMHFAAAQGNDEGIRALLRKGLDASALNEYGRSVFHAAVQNGQSQSLKLLFEGTDELPATDFKGWTLLDLAASQGFTEITEFPGLQKTPRFDPR